MTMDDGRLTMPSQQWSVIHGLWSKKTKTSRPQWDERGISRGTTHIHRPEHGRRAMRFALTIISFSYNVENTVQTTGKSFT
jgi:hypothetical protein